MNKTSKQSARDSNTQNVNVGKAFNVVLQYVVYTFDLGISNSNCKTLKRPCSEMF